MPKATKSRRFVEPRCGVSQAMIEAEASELGREFESYRLLSLADLKQMSGDRLRSYRRADESLRAVVDGVPEREQRAVIAMLGRDLHLLLELYMHFLRTIAVQSPKRSADPPAPPLPFSEWLFGK